MWSTKNATPYVTEIPVKTFPDIEWGDIIEWSPLVVHLRYYTLNNVVHSGTNTVYIEACPIRDVGLDPEWSRMTGTKINKQKAKISHGYYFRYSTKYLFLTILKSIYSIIIKIKQKQNKQLLFFLWAKTFRRNLIYTCPWVKSLCTTYSFELIVTKSSLFHQLFCIF